MSNNSVAGDDQGCPQQSAERDSNALGKFLPGLPAASVALAGFWAVHALSVRRQRRDEYFKLVQTVRDSVRKVAEEAAAAWLKDGNDTDAKNVGCILPSKLCRIGKQVEALRIRNKRFDVTQEIIRFRKAATLDIDDDCRRASRVKAQIALEQAANLDNALDLKFFHIFG